VAKSGSNSGRKLLGLVLLLCLLGGVGYGGWWLYRNRFPVKGIDVSRYQGKIDWKAVRASGIQFAFIKATESNTLVDPYFKVNWEGAGEAKIARGAYHFFRPSVDGISQAEQFLKLVKLSRTDLPPVLDLEVDEGMAANVIYNRVRDWVKVVEKGTGRKPIIYTLPHFARSYLEGGLVDCPLWVVDLGLFGPGKCGKWPTWTFWQQSHHGRVAGIEGEVDLDVFNGSQGDWDRYR
jgi:lysozyme